jgi:putative transcriptional regulator
MKQNSTIVARRAPDGSLVRVNVDGSTEPLSDKTDWDKVRAMTDDEVTAAALGDPDAQPITEERLGGMKRVPRTKTIRRALHLSQQEFASRYQIPLGTLRDWEQGRCEPDQTARAYLTVIVWDPERTAKALQRR